MQIGKTAKCSLFYNLHNVILKCPGKLRKPKIYIFAETACFLLNDYYYCLALFGLGGGGGQKVLAPISTFESFLDI